MIDKYARSRGFQNTDGNESVTFRPKTGASVWSTEGYLLFRVKRSFVTKTTAAGPGLLQKQDVVFRIYENDLAQADAPNPKLNDRIEDASGIVHAITDNVDVIGQGKIFVCRCQKLV